MFKKASKNIFYPAFTLVEVAIIIPLVLVVIGAFILTLINFTSHAVDSRKNNAIAVEAQGILNRMANDVADSTKFLVQNDFNVQSPQGSNNGTTKFTTSSSTLVLQTPLTKNNPRTVAASVDNFIYKPNSPLACADANVTTNSLATYNVVFSYSSGLKRRVVVPLDYSSLANACSTPWQKPTCASGRSGTYCSGGNDENLNQTTYMENLLFSFYEKELPMLASEVFTEPNLTIRQANLDRATSVKVSFRLSKYIDGETQSYNVERILPLN